MSEPGQGRARGRGGRGRKEKPAGPPGQEPYQQPPAPGGTGDGAAPVRVGRGRSRGARQAEPTHQDAEQVRTGPGGSVAPVVTGGRAVHRGAGREIAPPRGNGNGDSGIPTSQMGALSLTGRPDYRRMPYEKYVDKRYKDETKVSTGKGGKPVKLLANYFAVRLPEGLRIFQYHVDFKPYIENIKVKIGMVMGLEALGDTKLMDGGILYLTKYLPEDPMVFTAKRNYDDTPVTMTFTRKCEVMVTSPQFLQIANILLKRVQLKLGMHQIRDHYFNMNQSVRISKHKLEVVPGFTTAIAKHDGGNLLGVDIVHKILRTDTFLDTMYLLYDNLDQSGRKHQFQDECVKQYVGSIVLTRYNNKTYKVDDIAWDMRPYNTFEKNGQQVTYTDYYQTAWGHTVQDKDQPLLISRPTEKDKRRGDTQNLYLLPELCTITGLSDQMRSDFKVMQDLAVHTRIGPPQRVDTLEKFSKQINENPEAQAVLKRFGMTIDKKVLELEARELQPEKLCVRGPRGGGTTDISYEQKDADWSRNMRNISLLNPVKLMRWVFIFPMRNEVVANDFAESLHRVGKGMEMPIAQPIRIPLGKDRNDDYLQAIRKELRDDIQMVICVVANNKKDRYDAIKKACCIETPVPSQVVLVKTISRAQGLMSVATKIAIQLNCKMGGEVWGANIPAKGLMIIGLDTYHDSANKTESVGAMVASLNKECTRYYCKTEYHDKKAEIMQSLGVLMSGALKKYFDVNGCMPSKVIVYRDGVGDGQLDVVFRSEKEQMEQAFKMAGGEAFKPELAIIIVKKRINTRFFKAQGQLINPMPGTVVDSGVTKEEWYDFFLVSQSVRQGTVSPTSYNVIYDDTALRPDHLQALTYKLTHLYFNWQGTIRVPAPCQYAHKLAFLQGQSLHREFSAHLSDKLFFL